MDDFEFYPVLKLIHTNLKVIVKTQKQLLLEQQLQTKIAMETRDALLKKNAAGTPAATTPKIGKNPPPLFITPVQMAGVLDRNKDYARVMAKAIKQAHGLQPNGPLPIEIFCKASNISVEAVLRFLGYDPG